MPHALPLISTLAVGLVYALFGGLIAARLRLPPLVGYLVAGILVGPFTPGFVADVHLAPQLAEIGVILLMFGVGMHFSVRDLIAVRAIALPGAILQMAVTTGMGIVLAFLWHWNLGAGLVLGLSLSVASTVVLLRAQEAQGTANSDTSRIAVGWLVVEDLVMVVVLVVLPFFANALGGGVHQDNDVGAGGNNLIFTLALRLGKIALFVGLMLLAGKRVFPWLLKLVDHSGSEELFLLSVAAIALGVAYGSAEIFEVSFALGAFFAGVVISESDLSQRVARELRPLQSAFAVLFFVAVGMLFNPAILVREPLHIFAIVAVIVLGKSLVSVGLVLALRYPLGTALTVGASLSQIGEFSFILAGLGTRLHLLPQKGQSLIVAGALISIALNPLAFFLARLGNQKMAPLRSDALSHPDRLHQE
jgi:CPA2 family monovalent cation:H+ antiporter-2